MSGYQKARRSHNIKNDNRSLEREEVLKYPGTNIFFN
jgi:hypothetical protein